MITVTNAPLPARTQHQDAAADGRADRFDRVPMGKGLPMPSTSTKRRDPAALTGPLTGISFLAGVGGGIAIANSPYPRPGSTPAEIRRYFDESAPAARVSAIGQAISTAALIRFTEIGRASCRERV